MPPTDDKKIKEKIQNLILETLAMDKGLREEYKVGEKFKFIRDRLLALQVRLEEELKTRESEKKSSKNLTEDETLVYVYIYNAQGIVFSTWQKMLNPSVFYEYSVNRPIYNEKSHVEAFIRTKTNKAQHGFLTIVIQKKDILSPAPGIQAPKDQAGHTLIKIKEGSLHFDKMINFTHQHQEYTVDSSGRIIKNLNNH